METTDSYVDGRYTFTFWSAILDKNNREKTWSSSGDENVVRVLSFTYANLLDESTEEANVINIEYTDVGNEEIFCILQKGGKTSDILLHIPTLSESIKLVLKEGSGPVHITVHVGTEIVNEEKVESPPAKKKNTC